jgi:ATP-binding cassette, subfamily B, multidrug efflux pump
MASLQPMLTLFCSHTTAYFNDCHGVFIKNHATRFKKRQEAFEKFSDFTQENFSGITVVKAFVRELKEAMLLA